MLLEKVRQVEEVFGLLDEEISRFQSATSLHCKVGCGKCCHKPDIEATILEFVPFAHFLYTQDRAYEWLERLKIDTSSICTILDPTRAGVGHCSEYKYRGLICRLFGYSARTDKYGKRELVTCSIIKTEQSVSYQSAITGIDAGIDVPVMNQFYMRLHAIDADLTREFFPINEAIKRAIEVILHYYAYRE
ncbi:MAG TPA: YkgJ family cysteine cluster protein [Chryseolinea sp.]|nr:YkgJ family cysteine cluster protein [Chryseolinea sp.]